jgi:uncharacterized protein (TIGR02466 family)
MESVIHALFPTPVYQTVLREFTPQELEFIKALTPTKNVGNRVSLDTNIFGNLALADLKSLCLEALQDYVLKVLAPQSDVSFYITQSWANFTDTHEFHHQHTHQNSIISGVLYIETTENDRIFFHHPELYEQFSFGQSSYNMWNSKSWFFDVKAPQLFIFPSSLIHRVATKETPGTRISVSFNTFVKGKFGVNDQLNELELK